MVTALSLNEAQAILHFISSPSMYNNKIFQWTAATCAVTVDAIFTFTAGSKNKREQSINIEKQQQYIRVILSMSSGT